MRLTNQEFEEMFLKPKKMIKDENNHLLKNNKMLKVGDVVTITGDSGFCDEYKAKIIKILNRYDAVTGEPYVIYVTSSQSFDGRSLDAITPPMAYYIKLPIINGNSF